MVDEGWALVCAVGTITFDFVEYDFAQTDVIRSALYVLVLLDVFESFFEREYDRRDDPRFSISTARTHIGEFLRLGDIDYDVVVLSVFSDHLSGIHLFLREDEEATAILELVDGIGIGSAGFKCDE